MSLLCLHENAAPLKTVFAPAPLTQPDTAGSGHRGSALIAVVAAIVIFSVLAAALLPMISSSGQQAVMSNLADKANLLAESGYRYAVSRYRHAQTQGLEPNTLLDQLHDTTYTLNGGDHFSLDIYSYFYTVDGVIMSGASSFTAHAPGVFPADELLIDNFSGQSIQIKDHFYTISGNPTMVGDDRLDLTVDAGTPLPTIADKTMVYPVIYSQSATQTIDDDGTINYQDGQGHMFPLRNGQIVVAGRTLNYRRNNIVSHLLEGVHDANPNTPLSGLSIPDDTPMVLTPYSRIQSTGITSSGDTETRRMVTYYSTMSDPTSLPQRITYQEDFNGETSTNFSAPDGMGEVAVDQENQVLKVTEESGGKSLATLSTSVTQESFNAFRRSSGGYLSYDAQVKIGFSISEELLTNYAAGLSFRLTKRSDGDYNGYGISFLEAPFVGVPGIPESIIPVDNQLAIVLWQRTDNGQQWLAYKIIDDPAEWPIHNFTLLVRLTEATIIPFDTGGTAKIKTGDQIYGQTSGATGIVIAPPILSGGSWEGGDASGTLLLNDVSVIAWFGSNGATDEALTVVGKGVIAHLDGAPVENTARKANVIKAYYASKDGYGTPNNDPMDRNTAPYRRLETGDSLRWPVQDVEDWTADQDYFRLIQWDPDAVNSNSVPDMGLIKSSQEPNAVLRSYHKDLQSPDVGTQFTTAELGLHALGEHATHVYFDDFGFMLFIPPDNNIPSVFQQ